MRGSQLSLLGVALCGPAQSAEECYGVCGAGTRCEQRTCVAVEELTEDQPAATEPDKNPKRRRKKRSAGDRAVEGDAAPQPVADAAHVPRFRPDASQVIGADEGSERLSDRLVNRHLRTIDAEIDRCLALAAQRGFTDLVGSIDASFGIASSGKVTGVTARGPAALERAGIVACVRKSLFDHRFPSYDGPAMAVDYGFRVQ